MAAWWTSLSLKVVQSPLSQWSELGVVLCLRIWLVARWTGKMAATKRSNLGTQLWMNFSTYHSIIYFGSCDHWRTQQARNLGGRSDQHAVQWWCWKSRQGQFALEWEAVAQPEQRIRAKKFTAKLGLGLNFVGNVDFWVCNEDFNQKSVFLWRWKQSFLLLLKFKC